MKDDQWPEEEDFQETIIRTMGALHSEEQRGILPGDGRPRRLVGVEPDLLKALKDALPDESAETLATLERDLREAFRASRRAWDCQPSTLRKDADALRRWIAHPPDAAPEFIAVYLRHLADGIEAKAEEIASRDPRKKKAPKEKWPAECRTFAGLLFERLSSLRRNGAREAAQAICKALWGEACKALWGQEIEPPSTGSLYNWSKKKTQ